MLGLASRAGVGRGRAAARRPSPRGSSPGCARRPSPRPSPRPRRACDARCPAPRRRSARAHRSGRLARTCRNRGRPCAAPKPSLRQVSPIRACGADWEEGGRSLRIGSSLVVARLYLSPPHPSGRSSSSWRTRSRPTGWPRSAHTSTRSSRSSQASRAARMRSRSRAAQLRSTSRSSCSGSGRGTRSSARRSPSPRPRMRSGIPARQRSSSTATPTRGRSTRRCSTRRSPIGGGGARAFARSLRRRPVRPVLRLRRDPRRSATGTTWSSCRMPPSRSVRRTAAARRRSGRARRVLVQRQQDHHDERRRHARVGRRGLIEHARKLSTQARGRGAALRALRARVQLPAQQRARRARPGAACSSSPTASPPGGGSTTRYRELLDGVPGITFMPEAPLTARATTG